MPSDRTGRPVPVTPSRSGDLIPLPPAELKAAERYPNLAERIIRATRDVLASIALLLVILSFILGLRFLSAVGKAIDDIRPGPAVTGCPFGEGQCGG